MTVRCQQSSACLSSQHSQATRESRSDEADSADYIIVSLVRGLIQCVQQIDSTNIQAAVAPLGYKVYTATLSQADPGRSSSLCVYMGDGSHIRLHSASCHHQMQTGQTPMLSLLAQWRASGPAYLVRMKPCHSLSAAANAPSLRGAIWPMSSLCALPTEVSLESRIIALSQWVMASSFSLGLGGRTSAERSDAPCHPTGL